MFYLWVTVTLNLTSIYLSISTASPPLGDYVQVRVSAVLVEEMLLKIKSSHKICLVGVE